MSAWLVFSVGVVVGFVLGVIVVVGLFLWAVSDANTVL